MTTNFEFKRDAEGRPLWHAPLPNLSNPSTFGACQLCGEAWPCAEAVARTAPVPVTGIWLRSRLPDTLEVLAEIDGEWRVVIRETDGKHISYIVEPLGMRHAQPETPK